MSEKNSRVHLYLDSALDRFSNVALGLVLRSLGTEFKIAYVNSNFNGDGFLQEFKVNFFSYDNLDLSRDYDLVVFDNCSFENLSFEQIREIAENKEKYGEVVFVFSKKNEFEKLYDLADLISEYEYLNFDINKRNLTNITGDGKGKSTWCFGEMFRQFILGKKIKLVYFDKGGNFYSERFLFEKLNICFFVSGTQRFNGKKFRFENIDEDFEQAKIGLFELKKSLDEYDLVVAEELNTTISSGLLSLNKVLDVVDLYDSDLIISGRYANEKLLENTFRKIEVKDIKHYSKKGFVVKKGIDF